MSWSFEYKFEFKNVDKKLWIKIKEYLFKYGDEIDYDTIDSMIHVRWYYLHCGRFTRGNIISRDDKIIKYEEKIIPSEHLKKLSKIQPIILYYTVDIENKIVIFTDIEPKEILNK